MLPLLEKFCIMPSCFCTSKEARANLCYGLMQSICLRYHTTHILAGVKIKKMNEMFVLKGYAS